MCLFGHLYVFFGKMSLQVFCPFFNLVVCVSDVELYSYLHILDIDSLSVIPFAEVFSHSVGCLFILSMDGFLCCTKAFN